MKGVSLFAVLIALTQQVVAHRKQKGVYDLHYVLRERYDDVSRHVVPTVDDNNVTVKIGMSMNNIVEFDEERAILTVAAWQTMEWTDINLTWEPKEYNNIKTARLPSELIWQPDIKLYTSVTAGAMKDNDVMATIHNSGHVFLSQPVVYKVSCLKSAGEENGEKRQADAEGPSEWTCRFKFGSWTYDGFIISLDSRMDTMDLSNYVFDNTYDVISATVKTNVVYYPCCYEPYPDVTFEVGLRKK